MGLHLVLWITTFLALQAQVAWAKISIKPKHQHVQAAAGSNTTFVWSRDSNDPTEFYVGKWKHGADSLSEPVPVYANNATKGEINISFQQSGKFHLLAFKHDHKANVTTIKVKSLPNSSVFSHSQSIHVSPQKAFVDTSSSSSSSSSLPTSSPNTMLTSGDDQPKSKSEVPVIVAVCLGTVLLAVVGLFIVYLVLRKRHRKSLPPDLNNRYAFTYSSEAPSPTPSRSWLLRKLWDSPGDNVSTIDMTSQGIDGNKSWPDTINFYHTPRPPRKAIVKKSSRKTGSSSVVSGSAVSNGTDTSLSSMRFSPKTERQMEIDERIEELKGKLALLQRSIRVPEGRTDSRTLINMTHNMRIGKWRNQIEKLQELMGSDWALGRTDVIPKGLYGPESIV